MQANPGQKTIESELESAIHKAGGISDANAGSFSKVDIPYSSWSAARLVTHARNWVRAREKPSYFRFWIAKYVGLDPANVEKARCWDQSSQIQRYNVGSSWIWSYWWLQVKWARSARTDKGVSAVGQVVSLKMLVGDPNLVPAINSHLPAQIRVLGYTEATGQFDARLLCDKRR